MAPDTARRSRKRGSPGSDRRRCASGAVALILWLAGPSLALAAPATEPAELLQQARAPRLDPDGAVTLRDVELEMGPAILAVDSGVLFPARLDDGRAVEFVFLGQARFRLEPPDEIEAGQLDLFTGERTLDAGVEEAVIVLTGHQAVARLLERPPPRQLRGEQIERARALYEGWLTGTERRTPGIAASIFKSVIGDRAFENYFAVWCRGFDKGNILYHLDPERVEQIALSSFHPLEMTSWERRRLQHQIRIQRRKGRWLDLNVDDIGAWDVWVSTSWNPRLADTTPGSEGFEAEHYEVDATITRDEKRLQATTRLNLRTVASGRRVVRLALMPDLEVENVRDGSGRDLFYFRAGEEIAVLLPDSPAIGDAVSLEVDYAGQALQWAERKTWDLTETGTWYPHCGTVDRATYDVTLRWPRKLQLVASGQRVEGGRDGKYLWERRRLNLPSIAFSFVLGEFVVETRRVGDVDVTMAFHRPTHAPLHAMVRAGAMDTVERALGYFEETFGPYPLDELTLVTVPRSFSQSYLGFIALSSNSMGFEDPYGSATAWRRDTTIAHELAHQWWGNQVGWWSYRDQWLSEGMANYSALLYDSHVAGDGAEFLSVMSAGWRDSLSQTTLEGRTIESLGPIVLGNRLNSSRAANGYGAIVYRKGAVVLAMLSRAVGEERFREMLRSLTQAASNEVLTTEAFVKSIERMSGLDLTGFARKFIYGTGIPQVYYAHELEGDDAGGWVVEGEARLLGTPSYRHRIIRVPDGWDLVPEMRPTPRTGPSTLMVPFRLSVEVPERRHLARRAGQIFLHGDRDDFRIESAERPVELELDPRGEILARFYSSRLHPKRFRRLTAEDQANEGNVAAAEAGYRAALEVATTDERRDSGRPLLVRRVSGPGEDTKIRLALVRLFLDQRRHDDAERELDLVDQITGELFENLFFVERTTLRSRLDIQRGEFGPARRRLKKMLRAADRTQIGGGWRNMLWQVQLNSERRAMTEAYSLLAIAAHELNKDEELRWALEEARDRGVDVSALATSSPAGGVHRGPE